MSKVSNVRLGIVAFLFCCVVFAYSGASLAQATNKPSVEQTLQQSTNATVPTNQTDEAFTEVSAGTATVSDESQFWHNMWTIILSVGIVGILVVLVLRSGRSDTNEQ